MGKLVEGLWDCPYCDTKGVRGSMRECPNCGMPRGNNTKFYMPTKIKYVEEEKAKHISRNPDWICPYCDTLNSDSYTKCQSCGSIRTSENLDYFSSKEEKKDTLKQKFTKPSSIKKSSFDFFINNWKYFFIILGILVLFTGLIYLLIPKNEEITITSFSWERSISIEKYQTVNESGWYLPSNARLQNTQLEISGYKDVLDHYETRSRQVAKERLSHYEEVVVGYKDLGNGYFEEITTSRPIYETYYETEYYNEPVYRQEPIYATKYYYEIDKWLYDRSLDTSGKDKKPYWEDVQNLPENERVSNKTETYYINGINKKGKEKRVSLSYKDWNKLTVDQTVKLKISAFGSGELIE